MNIFEQYSLKYGKAICYSGFREGQSPDLGIYPSYNQVKEDLQLLRDDWKYLRLYDCDRHTQTVLEVIDNEGYDFKLMLGAYIGAEMNNLNCPWGGVYTEEQLVSNQKGNLERIEKLIEVSNQYSDIVMSISAGNEATVDWTDHYVPERKVIEYVRMLKEGTGKPVTFCENYVPWQGKLNKLAAEVDFISIHTYPVWEYKNVHEALDYTKQNLESVASLYPNKPIAITEAGWATNSNGRGIEPDNVSEEFQQQYINELLNWSKQENLLVFVFEAFDEPWKGSDEPMEPEKHWGLYTVDRKPKEILKQQSAKL